MFGFEKWYTYHMQAFKETTVWNADYHVPNHTYIVDSTRIVAYIPEGRSTPVVLKTPIKLDKRGRTFVAARMPKINLKPSAPVVSIAGSKGNVYEVTLGERPTCSCPAFTFRGQCKHIQQALGAH